MADRQAVSQPSNGVSTSHSASRKAAVILRMAQRGRRARTERRNGARRHVSRAVVRGQTTLRGSAQHIRKYLMPGLGHLRLADMRVVHVAEYLADVTSSDANRQRVRATCAALNDAIQQGLILINPAASAKLPSGARPKALVWTPQRVRRWEEAVERMASLLADDPARPQMELATQPPSAVTV